MAKYVTYSYSQSRIKKMNEVFKLPSNEAWTDHGEERLEQFHKVLQDEVGELLDAAKLTNVDRAVALADCLADIMVYCRSEAQRWGIPIDNVFNVVMDSQESKLVDGEPVMAEDGSKFVKGPHYQPPEPTIKKLFE